jgi:hypothetical protein
MAEVIFRVNGLRQVKAPNDLFASHNAADSGWQAGQGNFIIF